MYAVLQISTASRTTLWLSLRKAEDREVMIHEGLIMGVDCDFHTGLDFQTMQKAGVMEQDDFHNSETRKHAAWLES